MDFETAVSNMWRIADKPERLRVFHKIITEIGCPDGVTFWDEFWQIWITSENLNEDQEYFEELIRGYGMAFDVSTFNEEDSVEAVQNLPSVVTVYRGCTDMNREGWSWSLDRNIAEFFMKRAAGPGDRYILEGRVDRDIILNYLNGRGESEIVVDPKYVLVVGEEACELDQKKVSNNEVFYAVQNGSFFEDNDVVDKMRAEMMVNITTPPYESLIKQIEERLEFMAWADIKRGRRYEEILLGLFKEKHETNRTPKETGSQSFPL